MNWKLNMELFTESSAKHLKHKMAKASCCSRVIIFGRKPENTLNFHSTKSETSNFSIGLHHFVFTSLLNVSFCVLCSISTTQWFETPPRWMLAWMLVQFWAAPACLANTWECQCPARDLVTTLALEENLMSGETMLSYCIIYLHFVCS